MSKILLATVIIFVAGGLAACAGKDAASSVATAKFDLQAYEKEIREWRDERARRLQKPDGWLSLVGMHWLAVGTTRIGSAARNSTRLSVGPAHIGRLSLTTNGELSFQAEPGAGVTIDGESTTAAVRLSSDAEADASPTVVAFNKGDASFIVIKRGDRYALRVRDALAPTRTGFAGLDYFPVDPGFRFHARFTPHPPGQKIEVVNVLGMVEAMDNPGAVVFEKDGKTFSLEAVDEGDHRLFLIYADRTSGHESYPAARFLYAEYPGPDGTTLVDFNKGYNPPCAFTAYSTCPMPPLSNRLDLAIAAGEKKPRKPVGSLAR